MLSGTNIFCFKNRNKYNFQMLEFYLRKKPFAILVCCLKIVRKFGVEYIYTHNIKHITTSKYFPGVRKIKEMVFIITW